MPVPPSPPSPTPPARPPARVRPAQPDDVLAIATVHVDTWRATYAGLVPDDFLAALSVAQMAERRRASLAMAVNVDLVGLDAQGQVAGFATGGPERAGDAAHAGEVYALYVLPSAQTRGLGRALLEAMAAALAARGHRSLMVWVLAQNPARGFYAALGGVAGPEKTILIGGKELPEVSYGWESIRTVGRG